VNFASQLVSTEGNTRINTQIARIAGGLALAVAFASVMMVGLKTAAAQTAGSQDKTVPAAMAKLPWEYGVFVDGGFGTEDRSSYKFFWAGAHAGKVLTNPHGPGFLRGQFELAADIIPFWQAYTPKYQRANCYAVDGLINCSSLFPTGGTYTGISVTPAILRWNLTSGHRLLPFIQGAGGLIWTNHKFPPVGPYPATGHLGTSVFNFTPQFGLGLHYFVRPHQSITFAANAVHISNASIGDANPGVNASVQFSIGYTWWK
jgi:lipid A 3-O-deacylase